MNVAPRAVLLAHFRRIVSLIFLQNFCCGHDHKLNRRKQRLEFDATKMAIATRRTPHRRISSSVDAMVARRKREAEAELCPSASTTYAEVEAAGPAARPLEFPSPIVHRGHRISANAIDSQTGEIKRIKNVIVREKDFTDGSIPHVPSRGYRILKKLCDSAYGSVRLCVVMKRRHIFHGEVVSHQRSNQPNSLGSISEDRDYKCEKRMGQLTVADDVVWETADEYVVVKIMSWTKIRHYRGRHLEDPVKEIAALNLIGNSSPHVIGSIEVIQDDNFLYSIMPHCNGGDLYTLTMNEIATRESGRISESQARHWFQHILLGLNHLQKKGVCHRDLSLENILVHDDRCVVVDMGMSLRVPYADPNNDILSDASVGTTRLLLQAQGQGGRWTYMAPEIVSSEEEFDGFAVDLWAAGVILFIMLVGRAPWAMAIESDVHFNNFSSGGVKETLRHWDVPISDEACDLLQGMMWRDPKKRLTLAQVANHPWVTNPSSKNPAPRSKSTEEEHLEETVKKDITKVDDSESLQSKGDTSKIYACVTSHTPGKLLRGMLKEVRQL